ncbi:MAG TPA: hypothetical protein VG269_15120 [Tepidisphaeraceae bacterium]|jgi:hypothetical protein|nr:hypothetical protein [Tepidisphaeraceae bacterium]
MSNPVRLDYASPPPERPKRLAALVEIAFTTIFAGMLVGASTNAVNGAVSPDYFAAVMGWQSDIWRSSVTQGVLEGFVIGLVLAAAVTITIGVITRGTCEYGSALRWLARVILAVYGLWCVGGVLGVILAASQPAFFRNIAIGVPEGRGPLLRYAWVGGSIWGAYLGGAFCVIVGLVRFSMNWRRQLMGDAEKMRAAGPRGER